MVCKVPKSMLNNVVYSDSIQEKVAAAGYFRDTEDLGTYKAKSHFLAKLNNERENDMMAKQKERLSSLNGLMLVMFEQDDVVLPPASELFGVWSKKDGGGNRVIEPLEKLDMYRDDWLGLRKLNEDNRLFQVHINRKHIDFDENDITHNFLPFLKR